MLLAYRTEDEVRFLFGHILQLGLRTVQEAFAQKAARTDGYLALVDIVAGSRRVVLHAQQHLDTDLLVGFKHFVEHVVGRLKEADRTDGEQDDVQVIDQPLAQEKVH